MERVENVMERRIAIETVLEGGTIDGLTVSKVSNWSGVLLAAARDEVPSLVNREELLGSGVYLLVGEDEENSFKTAIYVGESDNVGNRLRQHYKDEKKDFAQRFICIVSIDRSLSKTSVRALEARLVRWMQTHQNVTVKNSILPTEAPLSDFEAAKVDGFFETAIICLSQIGLGWTFSSSQTIGLSESKPTFVDPMLPEIKDDPVFSDLEAIAKPDIANSAKEPVCDAPWFRFEIGKARAEGRPKGKGFLVRTGSTALVNGTSKVKRDLAYRENLVSQGILTPTDDVDVYRFTADHLFPSSSKAGGVVKNGNCSGPSIWKLPDTGRTLRDWEATRVENTAR